MAETSQIDKVAFTGSTATGRSILSAAAQSNLKKCTLELGGKSPQIVMNDADVEEAAAWTADGIFLNSGQNCEYQPSCRSALLTASGAAGSRIYVHKDVYERFLSEFKAAAKKIVVGDPFQKGSFQGPQISKVQFDKIMAYIQSARDEGATIETGGARHGDKGFFIEPTIITDVTKSHTVMREEIFGPVVVIATFENVEDVIDEANDSAYGLAAGIHSANMQKALVVARKLEAGSVYLNCYNRVHHQMPFGGYKSSGIGRELGSYALENYTQVKSIHLNLAFSKPTLKL